MNELLILGRPEIEAELDMSLCIAALDHGMRALSAGTVTVPLRSFMPIGEDRGVLALMPFATSSPFVFGLKTLSLLPANPAAGRPAIQGFIALFDQQTGAPAAIVDGAAVTAIRTAAASALATRELARGDARTHGILGTGAQALTHAHAIATVRPGLCETLVWGRSADKASAVAEQLACELDHPARAVSLEEAAGCDIVSAVTGSAQPLIDRAAISDGAHINLVGSHTRDKREASSDLIAAARLYVDLRSAALSEAGDILIPMAEGRIDADHIIGEIGEVLAGTKTARQDGSELTVYKSLGNAAQDLFAAATLVERCRQSGAGSRVPF